MTARAVLTRANLLRGAAGMATGFVAGWGVGRLSKLLGATRHTLRASDEIALMLGVILASLAGYLLVLAADRRRLARVIEPGGDLPASAEEVGLFQLQAAVLFLAGLLLVAPVLLSVVARQDRTIALATMGVALAVFALQAWLNLKIWRAADEFMRASLQSAAGMAFWIGQGVIFLWAAAEHLDLAPALTSWDAVVVLMSLYLTASAVIAIRAQRR